jgi:hypothetical protein
MAFDRPCDYDVELKPADCVKANVSSGAGPK